MLSCLYGFFAMALALGAALLSESIRWVIRKKIRSIADEERTMR